MKINEIKELLKVIDQTNLGFVKIENNELKLEVSKIYNDTLNIMTTKNILDKSKDQVIINDEFTEKDKIQNEKSHYIKAPLMGTFYSSSAPNESNFVKIGDLVKIGSPLCILEAMKLMNEITSDIDGEVVDILVNNEELVEYNQPLFKIKPL